MSRCCAARLGVSSTRLRHADMLHVCVLELQPCGEPVTGVWHRQDCRSNCCMQPRPLNMYRLSPDMQAAIDDPTDEALTASGAACCICLEDDLPQESMYSLACRHEYCGDCLRQHVTVAVEDARMVPR